jgi:hypothetical protein
MKAGGQIRKATRHYWECKTIESKKQRSYISSESLSDSSRILLLPSYCKTTKRIYFSDNYYCPPPPTPPISQNQTIPPETLTPTTPPPSDYASVDNSTTYSTR